MLELLFAFLPIILAIVLIIIIITQGYVKAPPDHAYIISGLRKEPRVLIGRAGLKIPFFEQLDKLYLGQITVDIKTDRDSFSDQVMAKASNDARVQAEADAAYEIQKQEQQKTIQTATVNAQIAKAEREAELRKQEVAVQQQALEAEINKKADADRYAIDFFASASL